MKLRAMKVSKASNEKKKLMGIPQQLSVPKMPPVQPPKKSKHEE